MTAYQLRQQCMEQTVSAMLPRGHLMGAMMAISGGCIMMNAQRMKQRCLDTATFDCQQTVAELLSSMEVQDSLSYFRSLLLLLPFVSCALHVRFVMTACLHVASTVALMLTFYLHPSRFDASVAVRIPKVESAPCAGPSRPHDRCM